MLYRTPGLSEFISGVILHVETLFQKDADGVDMVKLITDNGMLAGLKVDKGYDKVGLPNTAKGPLGHPEPWDKGIDDLEQRAADAYKQGARFGKWRNVLQIDPANGLPSDLAILECVHRLSRYAAICQRNRLVPIVEPEIVPNGDHPIEVCAAITEKVLTAQFAALKLHNVYLEGAVLKPNMVKNGLEGPKAPHREGRRAHHRRPQAHRPPGHARHLLPLGRDLARRGQRGDGDDQPQRDEQDVPVAAVVGLLLVRQGAPEDVHRHLDGQV